MVAKTDWPVIVRNVSGEPPKFFTQHEWDTIEAATARIYPTDAQPGALEAGVVNFIDLYLSGIDYIYASGDGSGFLQMSGRLADAWRERIGGMQVKYRDGIRELDRLAQKNFNQDFKDLTEARQDAILELLSDQPKPGKVSLTTTAPLGSALQGVGDDGLDFFHALCLHTRQGMFCDPVYGGNRNRVGWDFIGFPGPNSLKDTLDCSYSVRDRYKLDMPWEEFVPHLKTSKA